MKNLKAFIIPSVIGILGFRENRELIGKVLFPKDPKKIAEKLEQEWLFFCASANIKARIPSIDGMEALKNQWLRTIPNIEEHRNGFRGLNEGEQRRIFNAR